MNPKKILALLLAALMLAAPLASCGNSNGEMRETGTVETVTPEVNVNFNPDHITENGEARAHIVLAEGADDILTFATEELVYHVEKVSGATLPVVSETEANGLSVVIGTPSTTPELNELFPEDIAWLTTLEEDGRQYGDDGFAIRRLDGVLYIFGATSRGAMNGVYDFIEENLGVLWIRANEKIGLVCDHTPTITLIKTAYREKSPFKVRGWAAGWVTHMESMLLFSRNKLNSTDYTHAIPHGMSFFMWQHDLKQLVLESPIYDPTVTEYWNNTEDGAPIPLEEPSQVNFWSELTVDTVAAALIQRLTDNPENDNVGIGVEDNYTCTQYPESTLPFEYAPGKFVDPGDAAYLSTVYFTFVNKVARQVKAVHPNAKINTLAYALVEEPPLCELEDNIRVLVAPIERCLLDPIYDVENANNAMVYKNLEGWRTFSNDVGLYNYYGCSAALDRYERPIWYIMQEDLRYYVDCGFTLLLPQGVVDRADATEYWNEGATLGQQWDMNTLMYWLYGKLSWNPEEDVDTLIAYFCDKVYGEASDFMQEYYGLIKRGWYESENASMYLWNFKFQDERYFDVFVYQADLEADIIAALRAAYDAAETDVIKERIRPIKESFEAAFPEV